MQEASKDIRWIQRFQNYKRAFSLLDEIINDDGFDDYPVIIKEGAIQRFEYTLELGWKVFKDYLEYNYVKLIVTTPKNVVKECAAHGIFEEAGIKPEIYLKMLESRNFMSHTYDYDKFIKSVSKIKNVYFFQLRNEYEYFLSKELNE